MNIFYCKMCGNKIDKWMRSNAHFCGEECRKIHWEIKHRRLYKKKWQDNNQNGSSLEQ